MSYRNAIDLLTIAALAASARGVGLEDIERVLERDYSTAQRVIGALRERFPELEDFRDEESGRTRWKLPRTGIAPLLTPTADELAALYPKLGDWLKQRFAGWRAYVLTGDARVPKLIGLTPSKRIPLFNGDLECRLYEFVMVPGGARRRRGTLQS